MKRGSATGIDGTRVEFFTTISERGNASWLSDMAEYSMLLSSNNLPQWYMDKINSIRLIALPKPGEPLDSPKRRPIGIGTCWLKIVDVVLLNIYRDQIRKRLEPFNFGQSQSGMETFVEVIRTRQQQKSKWVIFKIDSTNAFNTLHRKVIFEQFSKYFPVLIPYLNAVYGSSRSCWTPTSSNSSVLIKSEEGVTQGHVWGSAIFNISTLEPILLTINKLLNPDNTESKGEAYAAHDDIAGLADPEYLASIWPELTHILSSVGLKINYSVGKSGIYFPPSMIREYYSHDFPEELQISRSGIIIVGTPIGTDTFCKTFWENNLIKPVVHDLPLICQWSNVQAALCLYRLCINTKFNYFLRMTNPEIEYIQSITNDIQRLLKIGLANILQRKINTNQPDNIDNDLSKIITPQVWEQATLPAHMGGFSIIDPVKVHIPAYIASQIASHKIIHMSQLAINTLKNHIISSANPFQIISNIITTESIINSLSQETIHLAEQYIDNFKVVEQIQNGDSIETVPTTLNSLVSNSAIRIQNFLTKAQHKFIRNSILNNNDVEYINRLNSSSAEGAIMITVLPTLWEYRINSPYVFAERLCFRLGITFPTLPDGICNCGDEINHFHVLSGCKTGNQRQCKHDAVKNEYQRLGTCSGLTTNMEVSDHNIITDIYSKERIDLKFNNYENARALFADIMITNVGQKKYVEATNYCTPGHAASIGESIKIDKYRAKCESIMDMFEPIVIEDHGRFGERARLVTNCLINRIKHRFSSVNSDDNDTTKRYWTARIVMALHRAACKAVAIKIQQIISYREKNSSSVKGDSEEERPQFTTDEDEYYINAQLGVVH
jgi:hypothetical protein